MTRPQPPHSLALLALLMSALAGCDRPDHIEIDPKAPRLTRKGETMQLYGKVMDRTGRVFSQERTKWSSRDPFIAAVDEMGKVAALASGHTVLTASWGELTANVPVEVDLVESLQVTPASLTVPLHGDAVKVAVTPLGFDNRPRKDREINLTSANPAVARVDPEGRVWGLSAGQTVVKARIDDKEADIPVTVR